MTDTQSLSLLGIFTPFLADKLTIQKSVVCKVNIRKDHLPVNGPQMLAMKPFDPYILESTIVIRPWFFRKGVVGEPSEGETRR